MTNSALVFRVEPPKQRERIHVLIRLVLLMAVAALGCGSFYWLAYLALPAAAALLIAQKGGERYIAEEGYGFARPLRWLAAAYAYLWLLTDGIQTGPASPVHFELVPSGVPTPASALMRLLSSLPAMLLLAVLSFLATILWIVGAFVVLVAGTLPAPIADFLEMTLRYQFRLIAYHLSLVDAYPSLQDQSPTSVTHPA
jgi:Domain of unknown function (DUF4389)